jgi:hypothetical protein
LFGLLFDPEEGNNVFSEALGSPRTAEAYNPDDSALLSHWRENLKSKKVNMPRIVKLYVTI